MVQIVWVITYTDNGEANCDVYDYESQAQLEYETYLRFPGQFKDVTIYRKEVK